MRAVGGGGGGPAAASLAAASAPGGGASGHVTADCLLRSGVLHDLPREVPGLQPASAAFRVRGVFTSHSATKHDAFVLYAASRRPRTCASLLAGPEQMPAPQLVEVLSHVFQRYSTTAFAQEAAIPVPPRLTKGASIDASLWRSRALLPGREMVDGVHLAVSH